MIIGSNTQFTVGERLTGLRDANRQVHPTMPFVVLREATKAEWLAQEEVSRVTLTDEDYQRISNPGVHFYEISVD